MTEKPIGPALRCMTCQKMLRKDELLKVGYCKFCGNRRVTDLRTINDKERELLLKWGYTDLVKEFVPMEVDDE